MNTINDYLNADDWSKCLNDCLNIKKEEQVDIFSLLETINIEIIEKFLRKKKLEKINNND